MGPVDRVLRFTELALLRLNNSNHRHPVVLTVEVDYTRPAMLSHFCFMLQPQNCHGESIQVFETFQLIAHVRYQLCAHQSRVRSQKHKYDIILKKYNDTLLKATSLLKHLILILVSHIYFPHM